MIVSADTQPPRRADSSAAIAPRLRRRARWEALGAAVAAMLVASAGTFGLWVTSSNSIHDNYRHYLIGLAVTASTLVDPTLHGGLRSAAQRNGPEYLRAVEPLHRMRRAVADVHYIYTVVREGSTVHFVLDSADPGGRTPDGMDDQAGVWEVYTESEPAMRLALGAGDQAGMPAATTHPFSDKWGTFMTGWAPLRDAAGHQYGAIGVDVDASVYLARLAAARFWALIGLVPAGVLITLLACAYYALRLRSLAHEQAAVDSAEAAHAALRELAHERRRLEQLIEGTDAGLWEWNIAGGEQMVDERWTAMLGYRLAEFDTRSWKALMHPEDIEGFDAATAECLATPGLTLKREFRMRHAEGHWVWVMTRGTVLERDAHGRALRMAGIHLDVSARKTADISLENSEQRLRSLFDLSPVGIALNDLQTGQFLQVNDALVAPTGYTRDELLRLQYWDLTPDRYAAQEHEQLELLKDRGSYGPYEKEYRRKDGSTYPVLLSGIRIWDSSGRAVIWSIVQDISERKAMESELAHAASRDKLTGLANRLLFMQCLHRAVERVQSGRQHLYAVLFLDFDRFKLVNDTLGHKAGDELLQQIGRRLRGTLRNADINAPEEDGNVVSRFGGDEFLILINDLKATGDATRIAERLLNALAPVYLISGSEVYSTASIGIVTGDRCQGSAEDIVRNADVAMYEAKRSGGACPVVFNEAMHTRLTRNVTIETDLRRAIGTSELSLLYQPVVELQSGRMVSAEALVRWQHPRLGPILASEFIPIAEESGLIVPLGRWVLKEACSTMMEWRRIDPQRAPATISVNISRAELALGRQLLEQVRACLDAVGMPAQCLQLEVTEREVMRNPEASLELMHALRRLGVKLAMDDFGTGTSSLAFLRQYPFDVVKIDRSFVRDLTQSADVLAVIHATINLVENLRMISLAEGVEEPSQVAVLLSLGCRQAQGYVFSRPVNAEALLDALQTPEEALSDPPENRVARAS